MGKYILILTVLMLCVSGCVKEKNYYQANYDFSGIDKIAIVAVTGQLENPEAQVQVADLFVMELLHKGYAPIPLSRAQSRVDEVIKSERIAIPQNGYAQMGQLLQVPAVLVINVPYLDDEVSISAQIIDTKDGSVLWMAQDFGDTRGASRNNNQDDFLMDPLLMLNRRPTQASQTMMVAPGKRPLNSMELQEAKILVSSICKSIPQAMYYPQGTGMVNPGTKVRTKPKRTSDW